MTSEEFADEVSEVVFNLRGRILGTGKEQYDSAEGQLIETFTERDLITNTIEELDDAIVYLAHLRSRLSKIQL